MNKFIKSGKTCINIKVKEDFMRRDFRKRKQQNDKIIVYSVVGVLVLLAIVFALLMYGNSLNKEAQKGQLSQGQIASIVKNETASESASSSIGKSVEEQEKKEKTNTIENTIKSNVTKNTTSTSKLVSTATTNTKSNSNQPKENSNTSVEKEERKKELSFQKTVDGEIIKEFAQDNLVYSDTLQEWVTHNGIDIKADKASVVNSAEEGTVKTIKNDPRYGLTIVIEHENGFQTVYANLLSSEFVTEGEKVTKGQAIGTVGNTAAFESTEEPHLHFEVIKDMVQVDPSIYLK